jgi:hypothetical protein
VLVTAVGTIIAVEYRRCLCLFNNAVEGRNAGEHHKQTTCSTCLNHEATDLLAIASTSIDIFLLHAWNGRKRFAAKEQNVEGIAFHVEDKTQYSTAALRRSNKVDTQGPPFLYVSDREQQANNNDRSRSTNCLHEDECRVEQCTW